jgi:hypothetical protein
MSAVGYTGWELDPVSRARLLAEFPPQFPDVLAHHVTHRFGVTQEDGMPPEGAQLQVVGYAVDKEFEESEASLECLVVAVNGNEKRPDGRVYHITWSLDRSRGRKPVDSNRVLHQFGFRRLSAAINISATPKFFGKE